ncbi:FAD-dependent monooxygenase [Lichenicoccus sp.]|uniref:FAD-dependent monooxygenase n=1 Tax=Lichenicoccus sp. TaxID=2781899 RepID=UPI003D0CC999
MTERMLDALVIGAGPVGLSLAIELGHRGITCLVVERNDRVGYSPRAKTTNVRTREHLRRWGIADALRQASPIPPDYGANVVFATRMNGPLLARFENAMHGRRERNELFSEEGQWVPQYTLEEVLRRHAASLEGVQIAFGCELNGFEASEDSVSAQLRQIETGEARTVRSRYLIGADGARSAVREAIGARMEGHSPGLKNYSIIFRAPELASRHGHGEAFMYWLVNADAPALLGPMDQHGLWFFMATKLADDVDPASVDPVALIRRGTGLDGLAIEIVRTDPWVAHSLIADRYAHGRVFLAGDACHLHPPFGGFGMNMGIGDAVDLGWKLAATLQGWGGGDLLASYQAERRPVHERVINEAMTNYATVGNQLVRPSMEAAGPEGDAVREQVGAQIRATKRREFDTLGVVLGYRYAGSPIIVSDGTVAPPEDTMRYVPSAVPGCLAPHQWLHDGSSLYDHFGAGYTLLVMRGDGAEADAFAAAAAGHGIPLRVIVPDDERLAKLYEARFALIRPDQHVAWRGAQLPEDPQSLLDRITGQSSGHAPREEYARAARSAS